MSTIEQEDILRDQILRAALQLYQKHGLKKVTMDDVSRAIGKSRSTLYYYFKNRDDIFEAVMAMLIEEVTAEIKAAMDKARTLKEKLRAFCLTKVKTSEDRRPFFTAIEAGMNADEISRHAQIISSIHKRLMRAEGALLKAALVAAVSAGAIRSLKPKEQEMLIFILLSGIRGIRRELLQEDSFTRLQPAVDTLTGMAMCWLEQAG
ncbi:TetR/AcrR family transcriptional regulator [Taibaiella chishuiensis]|uniref:TetR family transcriptional regulator n=1 Tax=Taibaiella chishuiensis TaxID=1434707 RepID=A0A2P8D1V6_9BACT|nr:TetR/AcrR family transcriptional regulator [Taibaiella chishuiensis]PSK91156.1 TetR family transcriptional regulator [Taibaiella chishuiensis]